MDIISLILILSTIAGLFIWNRAEARADARNMDAKIESHREKTEAQINSIKEAMINITVSIKDEINAIHMEIKDFHNRLYSLEEKYRQGKK